MKLPEYHTEEVTKLRFHPSSNKILFSSGGDGMINHYDLSQTDEDEILEATINTEAPVNDFGFFGSKNQYIHAISTMEEVAIYDIESACEMFKFCDIRKQLTQGAQTPINYLVNCHYSKDSDRLFLCSGSNSGGFLITHLSKKNLQPVMGLYDTMGHSDVIRDFLWIDDLKVIITAGEDSKICAWGAESKENKSNIQQVKAPSFVKKPRMKAERNNPYGKATRRKNRGKNYNDRKSTPYK